MTTHRERHHGEGDYDVTTEAGDDGAGEGEDGEDGEGSNENAGTE